MNSRVVAVLASVASKRLEDEGNLGLPGPIFVVGYSRSGTKFICNVIEQASRGRIEHVGELHFFGRLSRTEGERVARGETHAILRQLAEQYVKRKNCPYDSVEEILTAFGTIEADECPATRLDVLKLFLSAVARARKVDTLCDGTPRNAYYIGEILRGFPSARIVYMVRDPRDCVLSQKRKACLVYQRNAYREAVRLAINYNPVIMARFWASSIKWLERYGTDPRILTVRYEDMLQKPSRELGRISRFLKCHGMRNFATLVRSDNTGKYRSGLTAGEVASVEWMLDGSLTRHGYTPSTRYRWGALFAALWVARFALSAPLVYLLNMGRFSGVFHELKKRVFWRLGD